jgi:putative hydrolase
MSLLEGHGDVTMDRAGAAAVPGAERFSRVLRERRQQVRGPAKLLQQVLGLEAKLRQYAEGEAFVNAVERAGGAELFDRVWRGPEWLPSLAEIRDPGRWVARVGSSPSGHSPAVAG